MATPSKKPNILITGTPGVGKTSLGKLIADKCGLKHVEIGKVIKEKEFHGGKDTEFDCFVLDEASENQLLDDLEDTMSAGGVVVDFHSVDFFPERWFDVVFVLRTDNTILFDRLTARGYSLKKVQENVECEIMQTILTEAQDSYRAEIVHELKSNTPDECESNCAAIAKWFEEASKK